MVKFGRHLETFTQELHEQPHPPQQQPPSTSTSSSSSSPTAPSIPSPATLYIVPYNTLKTHLTNTTLFFEQWKENLHHVSSDFYNSMASLWSRIFSKISHRPESRGAIPDVALQLYIQCVGLEGSRELLSWVRTIHEISLMNAEALRKLAKKHDKLKAKMTKIEEEETTTNDDGTGKKMSACETLLPQLYASNFVIGQNLLEAGLQLLRIHLEFEEEDEEINDEEKKSEPQHDVHDDDDDDDDDDDNQSTHSSSSATALYPSYQKTKRKNSSSPPPEYDPTVTTKRSAVTFLRHLITSTQPPTLLSHLVAHRGYHCTRDRLSTGRPLENSQSAYESAWTAGLSLCECDVALTKDEKLILAHDDDFRRLALMPSDVDENVSRKVNELTLTEIMSLPLKSGVRPPLLIDVLRSANAIGESAKMVVEIKPGNAGAATAVARMLIRNPVLMRHCEAIMSFDLFVMHNLRKEFQIWVDEQKQHQRQKTTMTMQQDKQDVVVPSLLSSFPTRLSLGNLHETRTVTPRIGGGGHHQTLNNLTGLVIDENANNEGDNTNSNINKNQNDKETSIGYMYDSMDYFGVGLTSNDTDNDHHQHHNNNDCPTTSTPSQPEPEIVIPKLLLLTVSVPPQHPCELHLNITSPSTPSTVRSWLQSSDGTGRSLDGIYIQYEDSMTTPQGKEALRHLTDNWDVGVWGDKTQPDDFETFRYLVEDCGVCYVNTDLPRGFKRQKRSGSMGGGGEEGMMMMRKI